MTKSNLSQLAVAKKLADESGRHLADCMQEAAEIVIREHRKPRLPKVRAFYVGLSVSCVALISNAALGAAGVGAWLPVWASSCLLALALIGIFWMAPEVPLLSKYWTRWNTPAFVAAMLYALAVHHPLVRIVNDLAVILYFGVALLAALYGAANPTLALDKRLLTTRLMFHKLSPADQGRIFFLAPWLSPFGRP